MIVCTRMYVCTSTHTCMRVCAFTHAFTHACARAHKCVRVCVHLHMHVHMHSRSCPHQVCLRMHHGRICACLCVHSPHCSFPPHDTLVVRKSVHLTVCLCSSAKN